MRYAEVAVDLPTSHSETFTYSIPDQLVVSPGDLVWSPFGARSLQGIVFETGGESEVERTREIIRVAEGGPFIDPVRLMLARWVASYYRTGLYAAASAMLPPGSSTRLRWWLERAEFPPFEGELLRPRERRALDYVPPGGRVRRDRVIRKLGRGGLGVVERLVRRGYLVMTSSWERPRVKARYAASVELGVAAEEALRAAGVYRGGSSRRRADLLEWLAEGNGGETRAELGRRFGVSAVKGVLAAGLARLERVRVERDPLEGYAVQRRIPNDPTSEQAAAIGEITRALGLSGAGPRSADGGQEGVEGERDGKKAFLLYGVTGSGKTEVYLRAVDACLKLGRRALVLVPEIALTPQTLERFASRFPGKIALQHSGLSDGQRYDQWRRIRSGDFPIVLGSRGAVFAPVENLGLLVMDEEHEWTYKQHDQTPRYHARAVAERLCRLSGAVLVLGSATPDAVTYRRACRGGLGLLRLPHRVVSDGGGRPSGRPGARAEVRVVDMRDELRAGHTEMLSRPLIEAMRVSLDSGGRAILFINRRGSASFVQCRDCGGIRRCRRCDTSLTYHRSEGDSTPDMLVCHYCNYRIRAERGCRDCGGLQVRRLAPGTQAAAAAVASYFPRAGAIRWDSDSARTARDHARIVEEFERGEARVLVGTQMVAKGLDIPSVTLVGVLSADTGLAIPDYRSSERTFQLLAQVVGRSGRGLRGGRAIIQTFQPGHYAISAAAAQDYESFYESEISMRRMLANPPFTRLIRLTYSSSDMDEAHETARSIAARLRADRSRTGLTDTLVSGPTPGFPLRVRDTYRWHIALKGPRPERLLDASPPGRDCVVDVDPVSLA